MSRKGMLDSYDNRELNMPKTRNIFNLSQYPEKTTVTRIGKNTIQMKEYGEASSYERMAMISHYLHNTDLLSKTDCELAKRYIHDFILSNKLEYDEEYIWKLTENPVQLNMFHDFFDVPFPSPAKPKFTFIDLFAGIGGIRIPFGELEGKCVFSSEWDKAARMTYSSNFGEIPFGDITKIKADFIPRHDVLLAGFPCQAFSIMGKMKGFDDTRGTMFFEVARILDYHHPKAILLENVKQLVSHDKGNTFKVILESLYKLGYHVKWKVLNALDFGLPQKRERVIIVGFLDKEAADKFNFEFDKIPYSLESILEPEDELDHSLIASDEIQAKRQTRVAGKDVFYPSIWHENKSGNISVLPYACALRTGASYNYLLVNGYRRPSSRELLRLQGFPDKYNIVVSHTEIRKQTGNSVAVPMIRAVANKIVNLL